MTLSDLNQLTTALFDVIDSQRIFLQPGEVLLAEGDKEGSVFLLLDGELQVSRNFDGEKAVLALIDEPGSLVGEMVALGGGTRTATVVANRESELLEMSGDGFRAVLASNPQIAQDLVAIAIRRAEEGELAELLASHFGIVDEETLVSTARAVTWRRLLQGEVLITEGDRSDAVFFVIRGRLVATKYDPIEGETVVVGEVGRGDAVGEIGLLAQTPRTATVSAARDTVVAELSETAFLDLVDRQPRMAIDLCLRALARSEDSRWQTAPTSVIAIVAVGVPDLDGVIEGIVETLSGFGRVQHLSPEIVDAALGAEGIFNTGRNEIGDVRVSRMVHELELDADHLIVDLGRTPGPWSRRALGMADRVLVVVPAKVSEAQAEEVDRLLGGCPPNVARTTVIVRNDSGEKPTDSKRIKDRFFATDVVHIADGSSADIARLARVSVGRGNALILGGGGGRGFAHIGVYKALCELGVPIDIVGGTSIGAVVGTVIADGMTADEITDWAAKHFPKVLDYTLPVVSLIKGNRIASAARETFGDRQIEDLRTTYFAMSTDLTTSRTHIHDTGPVTLAIRATSAIPGVMPPVPNGKALLIDGGVLNNLPIDIARKMSPSGKVVAVDVAPPRGPGAHGDYGLAVSGWKALRSNFGANRSPYPKISAVLMRSMITASMRERDTQVQNNLADCYLDLDIRGVSMLDFDDPAGVARRGYEAAMPQLERWWHST